MLHHNYQRIRIANLTPSAAGTPSIFDSVRVIGEEVGINDNPNVVFAEGHANTKLLSDLITLRQRPNRPIIILGVDEINLTALSQRWRDDDWGSVSDLRISKSVGGRYSLSSIRVMTDIEVTTYSMTDVESLVTMMVIQRKCYGEYGGEHRPISDEIGAKFSFLANQSKKFKHQPPIYATTRVGNKFYTKTPSSNIVEIEPTDNSFKFYGDMAHVCGPMHAKLLQYHRDATHVIHANAIPSRTWGWVKTSSMVRTQLQTVVDSFDVYYELVDCCRIPSRHVTFATAGAGCLVVTDEPDKGMKWLLRYLGDYSN